MKCAVILLISLFAAMSSLAELRIWTSTSGTTIEAEYLSMSGRNVILKTSSDATKKIPLTAFCKKDQQYISDLKPPALELDVSRGMRRAAVKNDIDDKTEHFRFEMVVTEKKSKPYSKDLKLELYVIGLDLYNDTYKLLDKQEFTFKVKGKIKTKHTFEGQSIKTQYDPDPGWGIKLDNYIAMLSTADGQVIEIRGKEGYQDNLHVLRKANVGARFDEKMRPLK